MWYLEGFYKGKEYELSSTDIGYLQSFLTKLLRNDGTGFIWRKT